MTKDRVTGIVSLFWRDEAWIGRAERIHPVVIDVPPYGQRKLGNHG